MIYDNNKYKLSSGRIVHADDGVLGLGPDANLLYPGYDARRHRESADGSSHDDDQHGHELTAEERLEVAAEMIWRWFRWSRPA
jgi:hypothetical protein